MTEAQLFRECGKCRIFIGSGGRPW